MADSVFTVLLASTWLVYLAWGVTPMLWRDLWCCCVLALGLNWWLGAPLERKAAVFANALVLAALANASEGLLQWGRPLLYPVADAEAYSDGFMHQRNHFASLLMMGLLAFSLLQPKWHMERIWTAMQAAAAALLGAGLSLSGSRTGGLMLLAWWAILEARVAFGQPDEGSRRSRLLARIAVCAYLVVAFAPALLGMDRKIGILARVVEGEPACGRRVLWSNVLHLIAQKPWLGWGWGHLDSAHFTAEYPGRRFCEILDNAHNLPLHLAVELGVPVAVVFCSVCGWLVWRARPWAERIPARQVAWGVLAVIGFHSLLEYPLWYGPFLLAAVAAISLLSVRPGRGGEPASRPLALPIRFALPSLLLAICAYIAWDYHRISQVYLLPADRSAAYRTHTLQKIQGSWLFSSHVAFAELTLTPVTPDNAARVNAMAHRLLHFSPESRVVEKLIDSAQMLGKLDEVDFFTRRYKAAYPDPYRQWLARQTSSGAPFGAEVSGRAAGDGAAGGMAPGGQQGQ